MSALQTLLDRIQPPKIEYSDEPPPTSPELVKLMNRMWNRKWREMELEDVLDQLVDLQCELDFTKHLETCKNCQAELRLDIERYCGRRCPWYLNTFEYESSVDFDIYEVDPLYKDAPKTQNYHIGSYWEQVKYYRQRGTMKGYRNDTLKFILDRAKWAAPKIGSHVEELVDYYFEVEAWDLESPLSSRPDLFERELEDVDVD